MIGLTVLLSLFGVSEADAQGSGDPTGESPAETRGKEASPSSGGSRIPDARRSPKLRASSKGGSEPSSRRPSGPEADGVTSKAGAFGETLTINSKGLTVQYPEDIAKLRIGGRLQLDFGAARVRPSSLGPALDDNVAVRRSWIESYLTLRDAVELAFQYDFADATRPINDAVLAYRGLAPFIFTVGNFKEPFSLNQLISDNNTLFTERSLADALAPGRNFGGAIGASGEAWTAVTGIFAGNANTGIDDNGVAGTGRVTYAPILKPDEVLHLGIAGSYRTLDRTNLATSFASRPEAFLFATSKQLVNTRNIADAASVARVGVEAAYQHGPVRIQAEYILTNVDRFGGRPGVSFQGGYVEAGWVINGKGRPYRIKPPYGSEFGVFTGVEVEEGQRVARGGIGVFELGARYSVLDLADRDVRGGIERDMTVGLNWYPERNVRVMADYVRAEARPSAQLGGRAVNADIFIGRFQLYW